MTLPDIIIEENEAVIGGIRVINASPKWFNNGKIICKIGNLEISSKLPSVSPMNIRKVPFTFPKVKNDIIDEKVKAIVYLKNENNKVLSVDTLEVNVKSKYKHHKRTFISQIDGSVQYYSVAPSLTPDTDNQALFLSVHGASVEAVNQANAYKQKDWGHLVAPTNRRPYGYAWENWGRLDALEVLNHAENLFKTNPSRTYLTGHSMGGHGTWQLGVNYPDRFAAIAPCAGYPDLIGYRRSFLDRIENMSDEDFERWGTTKSKVLSVIESSKLKNESDIMIDSLIRRSGNPSRTLKLKRNYLHHGVFILHGEKDNVVPTRLAREMREVLGQFHNDFSYYEYPDGTHWYGDHSVDWPPLFQFFKDRELKKSSEIKNIEFYTGSPGVSSGSHFVNILQQKIPLEISSFSYKREDKTLTTDNVSSMSIDVNKMSGRSDTLLIDGQQFILPISEKIFLKQNSGNWEISDAPPLKEKGPHRNGGFKDAFNNNVVLVYASKGTEKENEWYYNRAKYDAEKFGYLGNGSIEIIEDTDFSLSAFLNRNVVLYGNKDNNTAWNKLLNNCPVQVSKNILAVGDDQLTGENLGTYFIYPRFDSDNASVGVVSATGEKGMIAAFANDYLGRDAYPDIIVFDDTMMIKGISGIKCTGFFGNDWSISNGDLIWK
jgi:pimeloyl-ACP methyl ester carboxylesterase